MATTQINHTKAKTITTPLPETETQSVEGEDEGTEESDETNTSAPSRTMVLQKAQSRLVSLLERSLGDDEEGKARVIRATAALLGFSDLPRM